MAEEDKIFFVFSAHRGYLESYGYVEAASREEVAEKLGGRLQEGCVILDKELFVYNEERNKYIYMRCNLTIHLGEHEIAACLRIADLQKIC